MSGVEVPTRDIGGALGHAPQPGAESVGPALTQLVQATAQAQQTLNALVRSAQHEERKRMQQFSKAGNTGETGDLLLELFTVPAMCTGYLGWVSIDEAGVTPANPDTSNDLYLALYAASGAGMTEAAQVVAAGSLLDAIPSAPNVNAQVPFTFVYGHWRTAPMLIGPSTFYLVVDAATAARQVSARGAVYIEQPDH